MLNELRIRNFAIIESLHIDWAPEFSVLTGETGAGKSIVIDALGAALGELCPDESLMVTGISHDWAYCNSGVSRMHVIEDVVTRRPQFRSF